MNDSAVYPFEFRLETIFKITASMYKGFDMKYAKSLAEKFGLDLKKRVGSLSTGYTTVFKVILSLASNADFIFLDEPVLGVDVNQRELFYKELVKRIYESNSCFIISTHLIEEIENLIDTVIVLNKGKITVNDSTESLLTEYIAVSGRAELVDEYSKGKEIIGCESMSVFKTAVFPARYCDTENVPDGLTVESVSLAKLFYHLTGGTFENEFSN